MRDTGTQDGGPAVALVVACSPSQIGLASCVGSDPVGDTRLELGRAVGRVLGVLVVPADTGNNLGVGQLERARRLTGCFALAGSDSSLDIGGFDDEAGWATGTSGTNRTSSFVEDIQFFDSYLLGCIRDLNKTFFSGFILVNSFFGRSCCHCFGSSGLADDSVQACLCRDRAFIGVQPCASLAGV